MRNSLASIALLVPLAGCAADSAEDTARLDAQAVATCADRGLVPDSAEFKSCLEELHAARGALSRPASPYRSRPGGSGY